MIKSITLEIEGGVPLVDAAYAAWEMSRDYKCEVKFDFNGIACEVSNWRESHTEVMERYMVAAARDAK